MNTRILTTVTLILLVGFSGFAFAGHHCHHGGMMHSWEMGKIDTDGDGSITFEEYTGSQQDKWRAGFDMIDADKSGDISTEEWDEFLYVHGMKKSE